MRIVIAPDSFKESLSAIKVASAISVGVSRVLPEAEIISIPMADGGEGTVEALVLATSGKIIRVPSVDALNRPIHSFYGILGDGKTALIEMAAASGIEWLLPEERNPLITSTFGTGLLLKAALDAGFSNIILGIGGSATNDGGAGMAQALGYQLQDIHGNEIGFGGGSLNKLHKIESSNVHPKLRSVKITVACDVKNPLLGPSGATHIYGPQKGATPKMIEILENNLTHFAKILQEKFDTNFSETPGAGAAGGLGAGLMAFCNAEMVSGFELITNISQLENQIRSADLVFTGEGKIDSQSSQGKTVGSLAKLGKKYQVPVVAMAGLVGEDSEYISGLSASFEIGNRLVTTEESKNKATELLSSTTEKIMKLITSKTTLCQQEIGILFAPESSPNYRAANKLSGVLLNQKIQ